MRIRVGSYNIQNGSWVGHDMAKIGHDIKRLGLDLVGLQEVDRHTGRVDGVDTLTPLWRATGLGYRRFCCSMPYDGGQYGTAVLSRFPILPWGRAKKRWHC